MDKYVIKKRKTDNVSIQIGLCANEPTVFHQSLPNRVVSEVSSSSSISSYFHQSGLRTNELKQVALDEQKTMYTLPKYFDVRWTEFTYNLLLNILRNWRILVKYFILKKHDKDNKTKAEGFLKNLTDVNKLKLLCFFVDLGYLYSRFQKQIQSDDVLIYDIAEKRNILIHSIENLREHHLLGGWESILENEIKTIDVEPENNHSNIMLKDIQLYEKKKNSRRKSHHLFVSDTRSFSAVRNDTLEHIKTFLADRLDAEEWKAFKPSERLSNTVTDSELNECHKMICPDINLVDFVTSYREASYTSEVAEKKMSIQLLKLFLLNEAWKPLSISVGRLLAAKPHSADVERLISYYNVLKTSGRSSLSPNTIKDCLYVKLNMPSVSEYNPKEAVLLWLNEKQRHSKVHEKATNQEWYQGVFPEAKADRLKQPTDDYNKCYSF